MTDIISDWIAANRVEGREWLSRKIECADGFSMSVQASEFHYCEPRENTGPWRSVEIGYPSDPLDPTLQEFGDGDDVFGWVPVEKAAYLVRKHGGIKT